MSGHEVPERRPGKHSSAGRPRWRRTLPVAALAVLLAGTAVVAQALTGSGDNATEQHPGAAAPTSGQTSAQATSPVGEPEDARTGVSAVSPLTDTSRTASASASPSPSVSRSRSASQARTASPLAGAVIVLDPGHNGGNSRHPEIINRQVRVVNGSKACDTTGTETDDGDPEHEFTWDLAVRLRTVLRERGATVVLTRGSNTGAGPCITERAAIGNRAGADLAISLHADGAGSSDRGFHLIAPGSVGSNSSIVTPSKHLAIAVRNAFEKGTGMPRSTYTGSGKALTVRTDLGGLNLSTVPKVFLECGNMRNATDAGLLGSPSWRDRAARAIADGMATHLAATG
ncbi:MAG: N-acetylmuramoyl-L-alanine amidase [Actinomycetota bacterium]|nr:N-acetylmuramoyl-L-alanine amidase [Actinomycetota bacterium]